MDHWTELYFLIVYYLSIVHGSRMPRKIGFTVVSWSGQEENYSAKELMVHAPTVSGWRSAR